VKRLDRYDGRAAFGTWVYRVATNACLDELRRRSRRPMPTDDPGAVTSATTTSTGSPEDAVTARIDVDAALAVVPLDFRAAVVLRDLCDLDYSEIADILDVAPGTVKSRIARGRAALADRLGNPDPSRTRPTS